MQTEAVFAGFGGQGVMLAGMILAETGMVLGKEVVWLPSYGPEMRGGTANCTVIISDEPIASPIVPNPRDVVVLNKPSLDKFCPAMQPSGFAVINKSLIPTDPGRDDITVVDVQANQIAIEAGTGKAANMVMLGAYVGVTDIVPFDALVESTRKKFASKAKFIPVNVTCLEKGYEIGKALRPA